MHYLTMFGTLLQSVLTTKVPLWFALALGICLAYYITRPEPLPQTVIEYRDIQAPAVTTTLLPERIAVYQEVTELRTDTIRVPVMLTGYQLWRPQEVTQLGNSIVVRSFDVGTLGYRDYEYRAPQPKFRANLNVSAYSDVMKWNPHVELEGIAWYRNVGAFTRVGVNHESPYVVAGIRYSIR